MERLLECLHAIVQNTGPLVTVTSNAEFVRLDIPAGSWIEWEWNCPEGSGVSELIRQTFEKPAWLIIHVDAEFEQIEYDGPLYQISYEIGQYQIYCL